MSWGIGEEKRPLKRLEEIVAKARPAPNGKLLESEQYNLKVRPVISCSNEDESVECHITTGYAIERSKLCHILLSFLISQVDLRSCPQSRYDALGHVKASFY